jgi:hypothetical protein
MKTAERLKGADLPLLENLSGLRQSGSEMTSLNRNAEAVRTMKDQLNEKRGKLGASDRALNAGFRDLVTQQTRQIDGLKVIQPSGLAQASFAFPRGMPQYHGDLVCSNCFSPISEVDPRSRVPEGILTKIFTREIV